MHVQKMRRSTLCKLIGRPTFDTELEMHYLDCIASHGDISNYRFLVNFYRELQSEPVLPEPFINGNDILALGLPESPKIGQLKTLAFDAQLNGKFKNRKQALNWLKKQVSE
jgi:hypothetical protein